MAQAVVERFQQNLMAVEQVIDQRNHGRPLACKYLKPSEIIK
ncbi:hypothetical protein NOC27_1828 [Nitrosococcus oceani AFC27]|nr:hypothetical protein NOC27_1828 [Nitrosococcus oceani AFC27]